jgi:hypothetical protein
MIEFKFEEHIVEGQKVILLDGEVFDWGLDEDSAEMANSSMKNEKEASVVHEDVMKFFLESLSSVVGFNVSMEQVNKALKEGRMEDGEHLGTSNLSEWDAFLDRGLYNLDRLKRFEKCPKST